MAEKTPLEHIGDRANALEAANCRLREVLPYIRFAVKKAAEAGTARLGILCEFPDGRGKIEASFEPAFLEDLYLVLDIPEATVEDETQMGARRLVDNILGVPR